MRDDNCENTCCSNEFPCIECERDNRGRFVWISQQQRDDWLTLTELMDEESFNPDMSTRLMQSLKAWDAAPDDPTEAVRTAVELFGGVWISEKMASHVLRALGDRRPTS